MNSRYQEWLTHIFDHAVENPQWYFDLDAPKFVARPEEIVELFGQTFLQAGKDLVKYTDTQADQGIWYAVCPTGSDFIHALRASEVPLAKRIETIGNIFYLYSDCFARRCKETLGHLSEKGSPLNLSCYMFWDISSLTCFEETPDSEQMQDAALDVLQKILTIKHRACQESALHGLGEFALPRPERTHKIVDQFLSTKPDEKLLAYALEAREGNVP